MRKLRFKRERAKEILLERYGDEKLDDKTVDLMLFRTELLARNELFIKEYKDLKIKKQKGSEDYDKKNHSLRKKWCIDDNSLYDVSKYRNYFSQVLEENYSDQHYSKEIGEAKESVRKLSENIPADLRDYERYLAVWDLKKIAENSWRLIVNQLKSKKDTLGLQEAYNSRDAINDYIAANKLIKRGLPGFAPFPQE